MSSVSEICDAVGRKEMCRRLGVTKAAIANAVSDKKFPPRWYLIVTQMCEEHGVECPAEAFNFATPTSGGAA